jgi:two-component system sensor histidine kinase/response regulator
VVVAGDGKQALILLEQQAFDLILMDVQMPNMDGLEAAAAIRENEKGRTHIPIVAVTAHAMKGDRERCLAAGMDAYISKPIRVAELNDTIEKLALSIAKIPAA